MIYKVYINSVTYNFSSISDIVVFLKGNNLPYDIIIDYEKANNNIDKFIRKHNYIPLLLILNKNNITSIKLDACILENKKYKFKYNNDKYKLSYDELKQFIKDRNINIIKYISLRKQLDERKMIMYYDDLDILHRIIIK